MKSQEPLCWLQCMYWMGSSTVRKVGTSYPYLTNWQHRHTHQRVSSQMFWPLNSVIIFMFYISYLLGPFFSNMECVQLVHLFWSVGRNCPFCLKFCWFCLQPFFLRSLTPVHWSLSALGSSSWYSSTLPKVTQRHVSSHSSSSTTQAPPPWSCRAAYTVQYCLPALRSYIKPSFLSDLGLASALVSLKGLDIQPHPLGQHLMWNQHPIPGLALSTFIKWDNTLTM